MKDAVLWFLLGSFLLGMLLLFLAFLKLRHWPGPARVRSRRVRSVLAGLVRFAVLLTLAILSVLPHPAIGALHALADPFALALEAGVQRVWGTGVFEGSLYFLCLLVAVYDLASSLVEQDQQENIIDG